MARNPLWRTTTDLKERIYSETLRLVKPPIGQVTCFPPNPGESERIYMVRAVLGDKIKITLKTKVQIKDIFYHVYLCILF